MTCYPVEESKAAHKAKSSAVTRMLVLLGAILFVSMNVVAPAGATVWDNITTMANGIATVMPAVGNIISAIIEPILLLVFVGFFVGLFDSLLGGIQHAFNFGRH